VTARRLASVLALPGLDTNLDCEKGIMRALTEHNHKVSLRPEKKPTVVLLGES
jgi:hypothetical protein